MGAVVAVDTRFIREINSSAILETLRTGGRMSVSVIASTTGLSRQAVTRSLNVLESHGLVEIYSPDRDTTRAGRPAQLVRFRAEASYALGIYVNPQQIRVALSDLAGTVVASHHTELNRGISAQQTSSALTSVINCVLESADVCREKVEFASVGTPGIIDTATGTIKMVPSMPELLGDALLCTLTDHLNCPVYIDNDVKLATRGEQWRGGDRDDESLVFVHWGERVGAGIVLQGQLYRGASNDAGDLGFLDVSTETAKGKYTSEDQEPIGLGSFEKWVGARELIRLAMLEADLQSNTRLISDVESADDGGFEIILDGALAGVPAAVQAINEVARRFAIGLAAIRAILDPKLIVIGGPMARLGEPLLESLRSHLAGQALNQPILEISTLGDDAVVQGAIHHSLTQIGEAKFQGRLIRRSDSRP